MPNCKVCQTDFIVTDQHRAFYQKIAVPEPTLCPICRAKRRLVFRNERDLYHRTCDLCHQSMIAIYPATAPFPVYCSTCWWSDRWDPTTYGRDINWNESFFKQFQALFMTVPKAGAIQLNNEDSDYNTMLAFSKRTYMCPGSYLMENCFYVRKSQSSRDCMNSAFLNKCELVADSTNCDTCYASHHLINSRNCSFSSYLDDCSGLQNSFMCCGQRNQTYCFKNKTYSQTKYEKILQSYQNKSTTEVEQEFRDFCATLPKRAQIQVQCENSTGDYLFNCHRAEVCFDCFDVDHGTYLIESNDVTDSMDLSMHDKEIELCYEMCSGGEKNYANKFCYCGVASTECEYLYSCFYLSNCFGCDGFHARKQWCILNKPYTEAEYKTLRQRLIAKMIEDKEYGEFFPAWLSPLAYNGSSAQDYYPLTAIEAEAQGFRWQEKPSPVGSSVDQTVSSCANCKKSFRLQPAELSLGEKIGVPPAVLCADCRYAKLASWKNPRQLWSRHCASCQQPITTTFAPDRPERVLCDQCYYLTTAAA